MAFFTVRGHAFQSEPGSVDSFHFLRIAGADYYLINEPPRLQLEGSGLNTFPIALRMLPDKPAPAGINS